ncbi:nuclear cap-binding protein subunit 1 isoform X2 [Nicotiana sylvestris]|uniref:Nuclear cap-binding protein subunit 1 n=1 Tax=Nicotiana sylvestris TaxID=4096 RepID=A0A1U7W5G2_NICSY|nr:PREDICTED: nuclear cap-binding protein subunit 1 isoform X2 [Nicotiana sylvestris]
MSSWKSLLLRLGEKCPEYAGNADFKDQIEACYSAVRRELEHSGDDIFPFLLQCAEQLPHKIPLYGTLVGLLNLENEEFVAKLVENAQINLQDALETGKCNKIRILMRFLTVLMCSKVIQPSALVVIFECLLSSSATTVDEEKGIPSWQARADFYITCILSCLPWGGAELVEQVPEEIERVMVGVEAYLSIRKRVSDAGFSVFEDIEETNNAVNEKDFLEDLWSRVQDLSSREWKLDSVPRPHLSFEAQLVAGKSHDLAPVSCPEQPGPSGVLSGIAFGRQKHEAELKYPQRIRRLNIFPSNKTEDIQPIDRFVVEEYLLDVLLFLNGCRKECTSYMVGLPVPFRYEYLMAETIFSQLLLLPQPPFKPTYYTLVIIDLCKALPGAFPAVVAGAVRALFDKIADLDMECRTRLILWFSHHLSNFQFIWPWEEWAHVLDLPKWAPQRVFVQEVLEREVRLSYWDKIKQSIENTPALEELLPPRGGPQFKYSEEDGTDPTERALSVELKDMVKGRKSAREMISWVEENVFPAHGFDITLRVVVQTLLDIGSKSFTHLITVLERYGQVIAKICTDDDQQVKLISEVSSYWQNSAQMTAISIDRMMSYRLISNLAIVRWVFSSSNLDRFHVSDSPWEILRNAVSKTYNRISDLRKEISSLERSVVLAEEAASRARDQLDSAESKLSIMDGEPVLGENPVRIKRLKSYAEKAKEEEVSVRESLEAKEALLARAVDEIKVLILSLYKGFLTALAEPLNDAFRDGTLRPSGQADEMNIDLEDSSVMDLDKDDGGRPKKSHPNGSREINGYNLDGKQQWCLSTLGYLKAFTRQYASEIWQNIEKLDAEVLTEDAHPLFRKAIYCGLRRPLDE